MRILKKVMALGLICLLASCSSLNPFSDDEKSPSEKAAQLQDFSPSYNAKVLWETSVGSGESFSFTPVLADGSLFAASHDGSLTRIDANTGKIEWSIESDAQLTAGVGSDGNVVAVVAKKGMIHTYDVDGELLWTKRASSEVLSAPAVGNGLVMVRSIDNRVVAYDADNGDKKWEVKRQSPALTLRSAPGLVVVGPTLVAALPGGRVLSIMLSNGMVRWEIAIGQPTGTTEIERIADVSGFPVIYQRSACATTYQARVGCVDVVSGKTLWAKNLSSNVGPGIDANYLFAVDSSDGVYAFNRANGQSAWKNEDFSLRKLSAPASIGSAVVVGDGEGYLHFLSRQDGSLLARLQIDNSPINVAPVAYGDTLIYQTNDGTIAAVGLE